MQHPFEVLAPEYQQYVAIMRPMPNRVAEIEAVAKRLINPASMANFQAVYGRIGVPSVVQATICEREDGNDFTKNPAQGDPWNRPSVHVPRNRGPFSSWVDAAIDAFTVCDHLNDNSAPWSLPYACWKWEGFNGFGYRSHGIRSPYVVGGTNLQQPGKYVADGVFDATHMDTQLGCLPIAMRMIELMPELAIGPDIKTMPVPNAIPTAQPTPTAVGGGLKGAKWVQSALNIVLDPSPALLVDGSYGKETRSAVRDYQGLRNLPQSGLVDDTMCAALDADLADLKPS